MNHDRPWLTYPSYLYLSNLLKTMFSNIVNRPISRMEARFHVFFVETSPWHLPGPPRHHNADWWQRRQTLLNIARHWLTLLDIYQHWQTLFLLTIRMFSNICRPRTTTDRTTHLSSAAVPAKHVLNRRGDLYWRTSVQNFVNNWIRLQTTKQCIVLEVQN